MNLLNIDSSLYIKVYNIILFKIDIILFKIDIIIYKILISNK